MAYTVLLYKKNKKNATLFLLISKIHQNSTFSTKKTKIIGDSSQFFVWFLFFNKGKKETSPSDSRKKIPPFEKGGILKIRNTRPTSAQIAGNYSVGLSLAFKVCIRVLSASRPAVNLS